MAKTRCSEFPSAIVNIFIAIKTHMITIARLVFVIVNASAIDTRPDQGRLLKSHLQNVQVL